MRFYLECDYYCASGLPETSAMPRRRVLFAACAALLFAITGQSAWCATIPVTNTNDTGAGSLRQAIMTANGTVNVPDVINFNISGAGPFTITPATPLPTVTDPVTIDGYTQSGSSANTLTVGDDAVLKIVVVDRLVIDTSNSVVRGLSIRQIQLGTAPGPRGSNVVEGCFVGLDASGSNTLASAGSGVFVQTPRNRIGGTSPGLRNVISGQGTTGMEIFEAFATNNIVQGNYIGTDRNGTTAIPNTDRAVVINMAASSNTIGGAVAGAGNLISGNLNRGITLDGANNVVQGNRIGTDATGVNPLGNARTGVEIGGPNNRVGGTNSGAGNIIAFNGVDGGGVFTTNGVDVSAAATGFSVSGNSIFQNAGLGIDLNADKLVTPGFPVLTQVSNIITATLIRGTHTPSTTSRFEFFSSPAPDPSGFGEGKDYLGATNVTTDAGGNFTINWPTPLAPGLFVTVTANGVTEFSQARMVTAPGGPNSWTNSIGGKWEGGTNWSLRMAPYQGNSIILITNAGSKTVTNDSTTATSFASSLTISNLLISAPGGAINTLLLRQGTSSPLTVLSNLVLNSGGAVVIENGSLRQNGPFSTGFRLDGSLTLLSGSIEATNDGVQTYVGNTSRGSLTVSNGFVRANYMIVGAGDGSDGTWNIAGGTNTIAGGAFDMADSLTATGTVSVTGGRLVVPNAYVGLFGNGRLFVSNGVVDCSGTALVGSQDGSQGTIVATGGTSTFGGMQIRESLLSTGSVLVAGSAVVRVNGLLDNSGNVTVAGGAFNVGADVTSETTGNSIVVTGGQFAATNGNSFLTSVTVSNGTFLARDVFLGNQRLGSFNQAGGLVAIPGSFNGFTVGANGGTGIVSQTGGQLLLTNTDLNVGGLFSPATGLLASANSSIIARTVYVGGQGGGTGTVALAGSTLISSNLLIGSSSWRNQLIASNAATLLTASNAFIGRDIGANSNSATLMGPGTQWLVNSNLYVGSNGALSRLVVSNGAQVVDSVGLVGAGVSSSNNLVWVSGAGSTWSNRSSLALGNSGAGNRLVITNGGFVWASSADVGLTTTSTNNEIQLVGPGAMLQVLFLLDLGANGGGNRLVVSNGARLRDDNCFIGLSATNNEAIVTGPGTSWTNTSGLYVGRFRGGNRLFVTNGAFVFSRGIYIGLDPASTNNRVVLDGSTILVTNTTGAGEYDLRRGTNVFNSGLLDVAQLWLLSPLSFLEFNGGILRTSGTTNGNGRVFTVGNGGAIPAVFELRGGTHVFSNNLALASNATLMGNGTVLGGVTNSGIISPGTSPGTINITGPLVLSNSSSLRFELGGYAPAQFDVLNVTGNVALAGNLNVTLTNNFIAALTNGASFTLLTATNPISGTFANLANGSTLTTADGYVRFTVLFAGLSTLRLTATQLVDTDGDGMPDWWEDLHGFNKLSAADASLDPDLDGASNLQEYLAGTNPNDPNSVFRIISIQRESDDLRVTWKAVGGKTYVVQTNANLTGNFANLAPPITMPGTGDLATNFLHVGAMTNAPGQNYRIRIP